MGLDVTFWTFNFIRYPILSFCSDHFVYWIKCFIIFCLFIEILTSGFKCEHIITQYNVIFDYFYYMQSYLPWQYGMSLHMALPKTKFRSSWPTKVKGIQNTPSKRSDTDCRRKGKFEKFILKLCLHLLLFEVWKVLRFCSAVWSIFSDCLNIS
jgi:hypothetical protein